jgi:thioredoxin 1
MIGPVLEEISGERDDVIIAKMDIDENPETPTSFGVRSIPTMLVFKGGEAVATAMGAKPKAQLTSWIDGALYAPNACHLKDCKRVPLWRPFLCAETMVK